MATIKQLDVPDDLLQAIERSAAAHGISVEEQVVRDLSLVEGNGESLTEAELLQAIRQERQAMAAKGVRLTPGDLAEAKAWGRK